jgi:hypothetical protein
MQHPDRVWTQLTRTVATLPLRHICPTRSWHGGIVGVIAKAGMGLTVILSQWAVTSPDNGRPGSTPKLGDERRKTGWIQ